MIKSTNETSAFINTQGTDFRCQKSHQNQLQNTVILPTYLRLTPHFW